LHIRRRNEQSSAGRRKRTDPAPPASFGREAKLRGRQRPF
jgi:hypothetical protein